MNEDPWRCTACGKETDAVLKSPIRPSLDAVVTQLDPRYAVRWCSWCKRPRESIRAATYAEAVAVRAEKHRRVPDATQIKGDW